MKTYKITLGGLGAELHIHQINEEKKELLKEMDVENNKSKFDLDEINKVLEVENWDYSDETYSGAYDNPSSYFISVEDEQGETIWETNDDSHLNDADFDDYISIEKENSLLIEHYVKGNFKEYTLSIPDTFDPEKLTPVVTEVNETVSVITDLKYDNKEMEIFDYGDNWSKGVFFHLS